MKDRTGWLENASTCDAHRGQPGIEPGIEYTILKLLRRTSGFGGTIIHVISLPSFGRFATSEPHASSRACLVA
jgi:hypothetical protein